MLKRFGPRFALLFFVLHYLPEPFDSLPYIDEPLGHAVEAAWQPVLNAVGHALGVDVPEYEMTGSGDGIRSWVKLLTALVLAALGAFAWSFEKRRTKDETVLDVARDFVRLVLSVGLLSYGLSKLTSLQMHELDEITRAGTFGESSPAGLLWKFMGASPAYQRLTGLIEFIAGMLLLSRRTTTFGAIVAMGAMGNVLALNLFYDVPVKIGSAAYLACAAFLAAPDLARIVRLVVLRQNTGPGDAEPAYLNGRRSRWVRMAAFPLLGVFTMYGAMLGRPENPYEQKKLPADAVIGTFYPLTQTPSTRWSRVLMTGTYFEAVSDAAVQVRGMYKSVDEYKTITLTHLRGATPVESTLALEQNGDELTIRGQLLEQAIEVRLLRHDASKDLLISRGFHWVQERPFIR